MKSRNRAGSLLVLAAFAASVHAQGWTMSNCSVSGISNQVKWIAGGNVTGGTTASAGIYLSAPNAFSPSNSAGVLVQGETHLQSGPAIISGSEEAGSVGTWNASFSFLPANSQYGVWRVYWKWLAEASVSGEPHMATHGSGSITAAVNNRGTNWAVLKLPHLPVYGSTLYQRTIDIPFRGGSTVTYKGIGYTTCGLTWDQVDSTGILSLGAWAAGTTQIDDIGAGGGTTGVGNLPMTGVVSHSLHFLGDNAIAQVRIGSTVVSESLAADLNSGELSVAFPATGTYNVSIKPKNFLRRTLSVNVTGYGTTLPHTFNFVSGDVTGDNKVNLSDYSNFSPYYGWTSANPDWTWPNSQGVSARDCDFNDDGVVNLTDYSQLSAHYGMVGDN